MVGRARLGLVALLAQPVQLGLQYHHTQSVKVNNKLTILRGSWLSKAIELIHCVRWGWAGSTCKRKPSAYSCLRRPASPSRAGSTYQSIHHFNYFGVSTQSFFLESLYSYLSIKHSFESIGSYFLASIIHFAILLFLGRHEIIHKNVYYYWYGRFV